MKINKKLSVLDIVNQVELYNKNKDNLSCLSVKARWNLKKNIKQLEKFSSTFYELKSSLQEELRNKYTTDEKSIQVVENQETIRKIKEECLDQYQNDIKDTNKKLDELLETEEEVSIYSINMDEEVEQMDPHANLSDEAMEMLMFYLED